MSQSIPATIPRSPSPISQRIYPIKKCLSKYSPQSNQWGTVLQDTEDGQGFIKATEFTIKNAIVFTSACRHAVTHKNKLKVIYTIKMNITQSDY